MALSFPIPTVVGQTVVLDGDIWVWDGIGWHVQSTIAPPDGLLSDKFSLYAWTPFGLSSDFVDGRTFSNAIFDTAARDGLRPGIDIATGRTVMQIDTEVMWYYNGANWIEFRSVRLRNTELPLAVGVAREGQPLFATVGAWAGEPSSYSYQWLRGGVPVPGAVGPMYETASADIGSRLSVNVTASKAGLDDVTATSSETAITLAGGAVSPLVNTGLPSIVGTPQEGQTLSVNAGSWNGYPVSFLYQWRRNGVAIGGATAATYVPVLLDVGTVLTVAVTALKDGTPSVTAISTATSAILAFAAVSPLVNTVLPAISGVAREGVLLSASTGTWTGSPTSFTYRWRRNGTNISGATNSTYTPVSADVGATLSVRVTAIKSGTADVQTTSAATSTVLAIALANTVAPVITGAIQEGMTATSSQGTWTGSPTGYAYQWRRNGVNISGATSNSYLMTAADAGTTLSVQVTASKVGVASVAALSLATVAVVAMPLTNVTPPVITGTAQVDQILTASSGTWTGSPTSFAYQWRRSGAVIPGATANTYTPSLADMDTPLTVQVTASKVGTADVSSTSSATSPVLTNGLVNLSLPVVSGTAIEGQTLTATTGAWSGEPSSFAYQWRRGGGNISGATSATYAISGADIGGTLSVAVTASKAGAPSVSAISVATGSVASTPIANTVLPVISGVAADGEILTASLGIWSGAPTGYAYQWLRNGSIMAGETSSSYGVVAGDIGATLSVRVTASKVGTASVQAVSAGTAAVTASRPMSLSLPTISGTLTEGQTLTTTTGTWAGSPTSYTYQWQRGYFPIPGETASTYVLAAGDTGAAMSVVVTATRDGLVSAPVQSALTNAIVALPLVNTALPTITGTVATGQTLTAVPGTWIGGPTSYTYEWLHVGSLPAAMSPPVVVNQQTFVVPPTWEGRQVTVRVTATKRDALSVAATSAATTIIAVTPLVNTVLPTISGTGYQNDPLTANPGTWTGLPTSYAYQWRRGGAPISGATSSTYTPVLADVGQVLTVQVTGFATGKTSVAAVSAATAAILAATAAIVNSGLPVITGTVADGQTLTATEGTWINGPTSFTYQWRRNGTNISGAAASTYLVALGDVGSTLSVQVVADKVGAVAVAAVSASTATVAVTPLVNLTLPTVTQLPKEGSRVFTGSGNWGGNPTGFLYAHLRNGVEIPGATSPGYNATFADIGSAISLRVTAQKAGATPVTVTSLPSPPVTPADVNSSMRVFGIMREGETVEAVGNISGNPTTVLRQWRRGSTDIVGATGSQYTLSAADVGSIITVRTTVSKAGVPDHIHLTSSQVEPVAAAGQPLIPLAAWPYRPPYFISTDLRVGEYGLATRGSAKGFPYDGTYIVEFDGIPRNGSSPSFYPLFDSDEGRRMTIASTWSKPGVSSIVIRSLPSPPLLSAALPIGVPISQHPFAPAASGALDSIDFMQVGMSVSGLLSQWFNEPTVRLYEWFRDGDPIPGAFGFSYIVQTADIGTRLTVRITASNESGTGAPATSVPTAIVIA